MREIKFRGMRIDNGEWVYGDLFTQFDNPQIITGVGIGQAHDVDPATVGQYTGLKDRNGTEIFEGDRLSYQDGYTGERSLGSIGFKDGWFFIVLDHTDQPEIAADFVDEMEIIGNIHEEQTNDTD